MSDTTSWFLKMLGCCPSSNTISSSISFNMHRTLSYWTHTTRHVHPYLVFHGMKPVIQKQPKSKTAQKGLWHKVKDCQNTVKRMTVQGKWQEIFLIFFFNHLWENARFLNLSFRVHQWNYRKKGTKKSYHFSKIKIYYKWTWQSQRHNVDGQVGYGLFLLQYCRRKKTKLKIPITCI